MRQCLKCKKEFQEKRDSAKFCSTSCRVMFNRKNPNPQKRAIEVKLEVLYNSLLEMVGKVNYQPHTTAPYEAPVKNNFKIDEVGQWEEPMGKSVSQHVKEISDLDTPYEYEQKEKEIKSDESLSKKERDDLLLMMKLPKN